MTKHCLIESLCILNDTDRPCMYLICRKFENRIIYVNKYLRRRYPNLQSDYVSYLSDYGFEYENEKYILKNPSKVKYCNGKIRRWQGRKSFTYDDILNFDGKSSDEGLR